MCNFWGLFIFTLDIILRFESLLCRPETFHQWERQKTWHTHPLSETWISIGRAFILWPILWSGLWSTDIVHKLPDYEVLNNQSDFFFFKDHIIGLKTCCSSRHAHGRGSGRNNEVVTSLVQIVEIRSWENKELPFLHLVFTSLSVSATPSQDGQNGALELTSFPPKLAAPATRGATFLWIFKSLISEGRE